MIRRKDLIKVLFICVCICHVCPAHPCGDNPMRFVNTFADKKGIDSASMLHFMRLNTPSDYSILMKEYRRYLDCTQMVQNGYFKRSVDHELRRQNALPSPFMEAARLHVRLPHQKEDSKHFKINKNGRNIMEYTSEESKRDSFIRPVKDRLIQILPKHTRSSNLNTILKRHLDNLLGDDLRNYQDKEPLISDTWDSVDDLIRRR